MRIPNAAPTLSTARPMPSTTYRTEPLTRANPTMPRLDSAGSTVVAQRPDSGSRACGGGAMLIGSSGIPGGKARTGRARTRATAGVVAEETTGADVLMARDVRASLRQKPELSGD